MKILAFDQATKTGWCFGDPDGAKPIFGKFHAPKRDADGERLMIIYDYAGELMDRWQPDLVVHEKAFMPVGDAYSGGDPVPAKFSNRVGFTKGKREKGQRAAFNVKVISLLQKIEGIIQLQAARRSLPIEAYGSRSWPPTILGGPVPQGSDVKQLVRMRARSLGHIAESDDESDAIGLWYHAAYGKPAAERAQGDLLAMATANL
jgi:Holliday junction resolvasome RuvABC endonuclease subunit